MVTAALRDVRVIDTDSHVIEPADLWTSRIASKWGDAIPQVAVRPGGSGRARWRVGDAWLHLPGIFGVAGWPEYPPSMPQTFDDIDPGGYDPNARLARMDEYGIYAQVLYPNLIGFETHAFIDLDPELSLLCTRAYNDFLTDFASADPNRLLPVGMVPFWDLEEAVKEVERCREIGHRGILFANQYEKIGLPPFFDPYWDPVYRVAEDLEMSINFHIGFSTGAHLLSPKRPTFVGATAQDEDPQAVDVTWTAKRNAILMLVSNGDTISNIVTTGILDRFPKLKFVSVESGMGYLPYLLESLDWHWKAHGAFRYSPLLPSEYFRRQCYGTFWFETGTLFHLNDYPDNFMFETDYPHSTSLSPGPASPADLPSVHIEKHFGKLPFDVAEKALWRNAAELYRVN
jgi:predicted TIM-barrel fold metal-dependent hydrolase